MEMLSFSMRVCLTASVTVSSILAALPEINQELFIAELINSQCASQKRLLQLCKGCFTTTEDLARPTMQGLSRHASAMEQPAGWFTVEVNDGGGSPISTEQLIIHTRSQ